MLKSPTTSGEDARVMLIAVNVVHGVKKSKGGMLTPQVVLRYMVFYVVFGFGDEKSSQWSIGYSLVVYWVY